MRTPAASCRRASPGGCLCARTSTRRSPDCSRACYAEREAMRVPCGSVPDLVACGGEHVPLGAEAVDALPAGLARGAVAGVGVERMPVVGHLAAPVAALGRAELRRGDA